MSPVVSQGLRPEFNEGCNSLVKGGAIILRVGGTNITASETIRHFFGGCTPTYDILGYNSCKEHMESLSDSVTRNMLAAIFLTGHAFIGL